MSFGAFSDREFLGENNILDLLQRTYQATRSLARRESTVGSLDQLTNDLGGQDAGQFRARDSLGRLRMIMSAINLLAEYGIDAHLAGFDENGVAQVWISADEGSIKAARGSLTLDKNGIFFSDAGDALIFYDPAYSQYGILTLRPAGGSNQSVLSLKIYRVTSETNLLTNGDFETGDMTGWTEVDTGDHITVEAVEQGYAVAFSHTTTVANYIEQSISATYGIVVTMRVKASGATGTTDIYCGPSTGMVATKIPINDTWRNITLTFNGTISDFRLAAATASTEHIYVDDIIVRATVATRSLLDMQVDNMLFGGPVTFNKDQYEFGDFRIRGQNDVNAFYLDASTDRAGFGCADPAYKVDVDGDVNVRTGHDYYRGGSKVATCLFFGVYGTISPMSTSPSFPFSVSIGRNMNLVSWEQSYYVATTNDGSNYWTITIERCSDSAVINSFTTAAGSPDAFNIVIDTSFSISSLSSSDAAIRIRCAKTGSPGALSLIGPVLEIK